MHPTGARLDAIVVDRNQPHKHVQRARIILVSANRLPVRQVAESIGVSRPMVRWQQRFAEAGAEALLRDKTRKPGKAPTPAATMTGKAPPHEARHSDPETGFRPPS